MDFLSENIVIVQSKFRNFNSIFSCSLCLHDKVTRDVNSKLQTEMVLKDLQKAFDAIHRNI